MKSRQNFFYVKIIKRSVLITNNPYHLPYVLECERRKEGVKCSDQAAAAWRVTECMARSFSFRFLCSADACFLLAAAMATLGRSLSL